MKKFLLSTLLVICAGVVLTACQKPVVQEKTPEAVISEEVSTTEDVVIEQETTEEEKKSENYQTYSATIELILDTPVGMQENSARVYRREGKVLYEFLEIPQMNPKMKIKKILSVEGKVYAQYEINGELVWGYEEGLAFPMEELFDLKKTSDMFLSEIDLGDTQTEVIREKEVQCIAQQEGGLNMKTCFLNGILFDGYSEDIETKMTMTLHVKGYTTDVSEEVFQMPEITYSIKELNENFQPLKE